MSSRYLLLVRMDIVHDHEETVNEIYEKDHIPALTAVPGVGTATRYWHPSPTDPRYIAAYEIDSPALIQRMCTVGSSCTSSRGAASAVVAVGASMSPPRDQRISGITGQTASLMVTAWLPRR